MAHAQQNHIRYMLGRHAWLQKPTYKEAQSLLKRHYPVSEVPVELAKDNLAGSCALPVAHAEGNVIIVVCICCGCFKVARDGAIVCSRSPC